MQLTAKHPLYAKAFLPTVLAALLTGLDSARRLPHIIQIREGSSASIVLYQIIVFFGCAAIVFLLSFIVCALITKTGGNRTTLSDGPSEHIFSSSDHGNGSSKIRANKEYRVRGPLDGTDGRLMVLSKALEDAMIADPDTVTYIETSRGTWRIQPNGVTLSCITGARDAGYTLENISFEDAESRISEEVSDDMCTVKQYRLR